MEPIESKMTDGGDMRVSNPPKGGQWCPIEAMFILSYHLAVEELI